MSHDDLIGLPNRRQFLVRVGAGMTRGELLEVAIVGIDRFRELRDTLGHDRADVLVRELGARLRRSLPAAALVARLTEDEFAVLAPTGRGPSGPALLELLQIVLRPSVMLGELAVAVDVNLSVARHADHAHEPGLLVRRATLALRAAKRERTGHRVYDQGVGDVGPERLALAGELSRAFERGEIGFEYQPQVDLRTGSSSARRRSCAGTTPSAGSSRPASSCRSSSRARSSVASPSPRSTRPCERRGAGATPASPRRSP